MPDIPAISVNLPHLSTVNLPDAKPVGSGHSTGMDHDILLNNIERILKAKKVSADAISKKAKRPDAIRNLRRRVKGDYDGSWTLDTLTDVAAALEISPWELLRPAGAIPVGEEFRDFVRDVIAEELGALERPQRVQKRKSR
jgi:hypothetical protein